MVTREELNRSYKLKVMLRGPSGSGKTFSCVQMAGYVASKGWNVLYLDNEKGSDEELRKLDDKSLENIIRVSFKNYKQITDAMKRYQEELKDKLKLIVIDPMHLVEMTRLSAREAFLEQGYYYLGEKKVEIDNKETFDLRGFMYQVSTSYQLTLLNEIVNCNQDIVCTLMMPNKHETDYDGKFSVVMEMYSAWVGNKIYYKAIPKKMRGVDLSMLPAIDNPHIKLLEGFKKKYDAMGSPNGTSTEVKDGEKKGDTKPPEVATVDAKKA